MRLDGSVKVQAVGAGSVNQAVKAIAIARRGLDDTLRTDLACYPEFIHIPAPNPGDGERSALRWTLFELSQGRKDRERDRDYYERDYDRDDRKQAPVSPTPNPPNSGKSMHTTPTHTRAHTGGFGPFFFARNTNFF